MPTPRELVVDHTQPGVYHCVSRCARRAFLMGEEYDHRRAWIEDRLRVLTSVFAIDDAAHTAMHNHLHVLLRTAPQRAEGWSAEEVVRRWAQLFPASIYRWADEPRPANEPADGDAAGAPEDDRKGHGHDGAAPRPRRPIPAHLFNTDVVSIPDTVIEKVARMPGRVEILRQRLANVSWFMKCLKEPLARLANAEDGVTGCFWDGRFKRYRVFGAAGILLCSAYIDLNHIRAGLTEILEDSTYTTIKLRVDAFREFLKAQGLDEVLAAVREIDGDTDEDGRGGQGGSPLLDAQLEALLTRAHADSAEPPWIAPLGGHGTDEREPLLDMRPNAYFDFVEALGRQAREDKRGSIPRHVTSVLERLEVNVKAWLDIVVHDNVRWFGTAIGTAEQLAAEAARRGMKRVIGAVRVFDPPPTLDAAPG